MKQKLIIKIFTFIALSSILGCGGPPIGGVQDTCTTSEEDLTIYLQFPTTGLKPQSNPSSLTAYGTNEEYKADVYNKIYCVVEIKGIDCKYDRQYVWKYGNFMDIKVPVHTKYDIKILYYDTCRPNNTRSLYIFEQAKVTKTGLIVLNANLSHTGARTGCYK